MQLWKFKTAFKVLLGMLLFWACGPQTSVQPIPNVEQVVSDDQDTSLSVSEGAAKGTQVNVPIGALAVGSTVDLGKADTPSEFKIDNISSASTSIEVSAKDASGNSVTELNSPMTIAIPYQTSAGLVAVDSVKENLCALLKSRSGLFLWRYSDLTVLEETQKVSFQSKYLGVFKLVYCGTELMDGFKDASEEGATGEEQINFSITIDSSTYKLDSEKYCMIVIAEKDDDNKDDNKDSDEDREPAVILAKDQATVDGSSIELSGSFGGSKIPSDYNGLIIISTHSSTDQSCEDLSVGDDIDKSNYSFLQAFIFGFTNTDLIAGSATGKFGEGVYALDTVSLKIGRPNSDPDGTNAPGAFEKNLCFHADTEYGFTAVNLPINSDGQINGQEEVKILIPSKSGDLQAEFEIGRDCGPGDDEKTEGNFEPYHGTFIDAKFGDQLYLVPTNISADPIYNGQKACLEVIPGGTSNTSTDSRNRLFAASLEFGSQNYNAYIPYYTDTNDLRINIGAFCETDTGGTTTTVENEAVDGDLYVSPPAN